MNKTNTVTLYLKDYEDLTKQIYELKGRNSAFNAKDVFGFYVYHGGFSHTEYYIKSKDEATQALVDKVRKQYAEIKSLQKENAALTKKITKKRFWLF